MNYGRYKIVSELGRGAMGMVYQAHDPQIDRMVALKVLREDRLTTEDYVQRFLKEATAIGRLSHPGIVTVYDVGQDHGTIYIAMEFLEGQSLDQVMKSTNLSIQDIVNIGIQVSQALQYAHKKGIVHRDIKPPNIIYTPEMFTKVTDFGIAHIDDPDGQQMTRAGEILGTPVYMAPEQVMGQSVDGRSDLYSLGVILYELTTGRRPFKGDNLAAVFRAITHDDPVAPNQLNPDVPPALSNLILKAMAKKPEDRFATGQELASLLDSCLNDQAHESFTETVIQQAQPKEKSRIGLILTVLLLLCGAGLAAFLYLKPNEIETPANTIQAINEQQEITPPTEEEHPPATLPITIEEPEEPSAPIAITPGSRKIIKQLPVVEAVPVLPEKMDPVISSPPPVVPATAEESFQRQQAAESIEELFTEERKAEPEPTITKTKVEAAAIVAPQPPVKEEIAPLLPPQKEQQADIQQKMATLAINSTPPGASLYIDGDYQGLTPIEVDITAIKHEVKLELQGHLGWQAQLNLSKGGRIPLSIPLLAE